METKQKIINWIFLHCEELDWNIDLSDLSVKAIYNGVTIRMALDEQNKLYLETYENPYDSCYTIDESGVFPEIRDLYNKIHDVISSNAENKHFKTILGKLTGHEK